MSSCPSCGSENPDGFRFCGSCGSPLAAGAPAAREERKVVTVLFCDLVGSTAQAERLDPEDVRAILSRYHEQVRGNLERFGGTVEKFIGDAVMAVFGAPVAHEDDPERAVRAALAIRDQALDDGGLQVRIAVHTGEALVALGARPAEGEAMVAGDVVNTAARLQSAAPVNGILVGAQTHRATERAIEYRDHEPVRAKGKTDPIPVWQAVQARSRFGVDVARPSGPPLVGRKEETELLAAALRRAVDDRTPQLVTLVGVPGIGKSRLLAELFAAIDRGDKLVTWRQGRSLPYGEGVSYWALGEMVKAQAGILETDAADEAGRKLREAVERLAPEAAEAAWIESHLRPLAGLGAGDATGDRRGEAFAAWRRFFEALGEQRPLVLVFEDLHWADEGLLDFVDHLVDWLTDVPVLVVASARPELLARRPAWSGGKANATTISLAPLSDEETARLVHALLDRSVLPADVQSALLERAGGNPLYAEEFVRMVAERGGSELPESVQGIIAARLDALDADDKALLQHAAVVGKVFWSGALAAIGERERLAVEERLHALERRELVRRERRSSVAGESEYAFRHVLVRDVAYGAIPRAARAERHRRAAEWIESLGRPDDHADLLAHHYLSALELARAAGVDAGVLAGSAAVALRRAGDRAFGLNAFAPAARFYDEALELGIPNDELPHVLFRLGAALHLAADERRTDVLARARDALLASGDPETAAEATALLAEACWFRGESDRHREELARAQDLVRGRPASAAAARVLAQASRYAMLAGDHDEAVRVGREALAMAEELGLDDLVPNALNNIGVARASSGDHSGGVADLERAIEVGLATSNPDAARAYNNLASIYAGGGQLRRADELWRAGKEVADRLGNATLSRWIGVQSWWSLEREGRWDECLEMADAFIAECEAGSPHYLERTAHELRAEILLARDDAKGAGEAAARSLEIAREAGDPQSVLPALTLKAAVDLELGRVDEARLAAREWLSRRDVAAGGLGLIRLALAAERLGLADEAGRAAAELPDADSLRGRVAAAILAGELARAADIAVEMGSRSLEAELRLRAAEALAAQGRRAEADEQLRQALPFYRSVGATRYVRRGEALLARTA
ncbi:MAG TPA: AAA family ATPase [Gaiellaceae bacterium]|nr:AAA family ATPase [Gaiellaceae bacterium]